MAINQLQIPTSGNINNLVDQSQWSSLANLGNVYQKAQQDAANKAAFAQYQQTGDPKALIGSGDMNLAQLGVTAQNHMDLLRQQALENARSESHFGQEMKYKYKALDQADRPKYHYVTNDWGETEAYKETDNGLERVPLGKATAEDPSGAAAATLAPPSAPAAAAPARPAFPAPLPSQGAAASFPASLPGQMPVRPVAPAPPPVQQPAVDLHAALGVPRPQLAPETPGQMAPQMASQVAPAGAPAPPISTDNMAPLASLAPQNVPTWAQPPQALGQAVGAPQPQDAAAAEPPPVMSGLKFDELQKEAEFKPPGARNEQLLAQIAARNTNVATDVKGIADGDIDLRQMPKKQQLFLSSLVKQYDPSFSTGRFKAKQEFISGGPNSPASTLVTGATAIGHIFDAFQNQKELGGTGDYGFLNKAINKTNVLGMEWKDNPALAGYNANIGKVAEEGTKFYRGTGGTESDISRDIGSMSASHSPQARVQTLATAATLMMSKVAGLQDRWKNAIGEKAYNEQIAREGGNQIFTQENLTKVNEMRNAAGMKPVDMRGREISTAARAMQLQASGIRDKAELYERLHREGFQ